MRELAWKGDSHERNLPTLIYGCTKEDPVYDARGVGPVLEPTATATTRAAILWYGHKGYDVTSD